MSDRDELLRLYSAAIDEIYALRTIMAAESRRIEVDLDYRSYPKGRRGPAEAFRDGLAAAARGDYTDAYGLVVRKKAALEHVGAEQTLTRQEWEAQHAAREAKHARHRAQRQETP